MRWGTDKADALGLESYIEASDPGKLLYSTHGFRVMRELHVDMSLSERARAATATSDNSLKTEWEALREWYLPKGYHFHSMWRPIGGKWDEDEVNRIWRERFETWDAAKYQNGRHLVMVEWRESFSLLYPNIDCIVPKIVKHSACSAPLLTFNLPFAISNGSSWASLKIHFLVWNRRYVPTLSRLSDSNTIPRFHWMR